jgi:hypothetical protein
MNDFFVGFVLAPVGKQKLKYCLAGAAPQNMN